MLSRVFTTREQMLMVGSAIAIFVGGIAYYLSNEKAPASVEIKESRISVPTSPISDAATHPAMAPPAAAAPPPSDPPKVLVAPANPPHKIRVSVTGAVTTPGVYDLSEHKRVEDALAAAGGAMPTGDLSDINKAAELIDGSALVIPFAGVQGLEDGKRLVIRSGQSAASLNPPEYTISGWKTTKRAGPSAQTSAPSAPGPAAKTVSAGGGPLDLNTATADELATLPGIGPKLADAIIQYRQQQPFGSVDDLNNVPGIGDKRLAQLRPHVRVGSQ